MSTHSLDEQEPEENKGLMRLVVIIVAVALAVGLAFFSGVHSQAPPVTIVGTLGSDDKVKYYSDGKGAPAPATDGVPPSRQ